MVFNIYAILVSSLVTLVMGFIWYHPKVFGTIWMKETGMTEEKARQGNMLKVFGLTLVYSILFAFWLPNLVIHQTGVLEAAGGNDQDSAFIAFMEVHGDAFRYFKHGALHGFFSGVFLILPVIAINSLFEQKTWKYILVTAGYWMVSMAIMGGIICAWK